MNPAKYKSVSMKISSWEKATELSKKILPNATISRSQIVELALDRLGNEVSIQALKPTEEKHASNN